MRSMGKICDGLLAVAALLAVSSGTALQGQTPHLRIWPSQPPADIPFEPSKELTGVAFTGRSAHYEHADTWFPVWAANGNLYSSWTDGEVGGLRSDSKGPKATTGFATITGDDPLHLTISDVGTFPGSPLPYGGRYPAGGLIHHGVWFYGTYCLLETPGKGLNWDVLGPFVGFTTSSDYGKTWHQPPQTPEHPLFDEPRHPGAAVKLGLPHFVDFGRDMQFSPDGKAYLVSQGAEDDDPQPRDANLSWITGDSIYLARVKPSLSTMNRRSAYEYFGGSDSRGHPIWSRNFASIKPLIDWNNHTGNVSITYDAPLRKYLMLVTDGGNTVGKYSTYILESNRVTGPWRLVTYLRDFGEQAYFVNIPSKFIHADGRTMWISYSANFTNVFNHTSFKTEPENSGYWWTLQEIQLIGPGFPPTR